MRYIILYIVASIFTISCKQESLTNNVAAANKSGKELSIIHCSSCHLHPSPSLIDKKTWSSNVLPEMSYYMGIKPISDKMFSMDEKDFDGLIQSNYFPDKARVSMEDWNKIVAYYIANSPDSLIIDSPEKKCKNFEAFWIKKI